MTLARWIGCGGLLGLLTLLKGPMPLGFFSLGVAAYVALERRWRDVPGLFVCMTIPAVVILAWGIAVYRTGDEQIWLTVHGGRLPALSDYLARNPRRALTLVLELMPALLLAPLAAHLWWRGRTTEPGPADRQTARSLFGFVHRRDRDVAGVRQPLCHADGACGRGARWNRLGRAGENGIWPPEMDCRRAADEIRGFQLVLVTVIVPIHADRFSATRLDGQALERVVRAAPAQVFCTDFATNQLFYVRMPMQCLDRAALASLAAPAWLLIPQSQLSQIVSCGRISKSTASSRRSRVFNCWLHAWKSADPKSAYDATRAVRPMRLPC